VSEEPNETDPTTLIISTVETIENLAIDASIKALKEKTSNPLSALYLSLGILEDAKIRVRELCYKTMKTELEKRLRNVEKIKRDLK
jgi:hypothetical protein